MQCIYEMQRAKDLQGAIDMYSSSIREIDVLLKNEVLLKKEPQRKAELKMFREEYTADVKKWREELQCLKPEPPVYKNTK